MNKFKKVTLSLCVGLLVASPLSLQQSEAKTVDNNYKSKGVLLPGAQRQQVSDTTHGIYPAVSFVNIGDRAIASGVVIGKNTLLTNRHVASNTNRLTVFPGAQGEGQYPFGGFEGEDYKLSPTGEDLAVVHLHPNENGESIGDVVNPVPLGDGEELQVGDPVDVTGFPGDKPMATMWESLGSVTGVQGNIVRYDASTYGGNSGSPVFNNENEVIGVHFGGVDSMYNHAVLLTPEIKSFIKSELR